MKKIRLFHTMEICSVAMIFFFCSENSLSQNLSINTDGTAAETGVLLDVKGINPKATTATETVFQVKSFDASASALKLRLILGTDATASLRYGAIDVYDAGAGVYRDLSLQPLGGNVGIGTTNPTSKLTVVDGNIDVVQNTYAIVRGYTYSSAATGVSSAFIGFRGRGTYSSPSYPLANDMLATFQGRNAISANTWPGMIISASENHSATAAGTDIWFATVLNGGTITSERMRIIDDGSVGIGTATPAYQLQISTNSAAKPTSSLWTVPSDERLKRDVRTFTQGLDAIMQINPIWFNYNGKAGISKDEGGVGALAQDIEKICPYMIKPFNYTDTASGITTTYMGVDYGAMDFILINAIKEQQKIIDNQQATIGKLQTEILNLKNLILNQQTNYDTRLKTLEELLGAKSEK